MSNPNFLTANTQGIELMPGVNDTAVGYDVNRIVQALNGTNILPITTGDLTVVGNETISGTLSINSNLTVSGTITATGGIIGPIALGAPVTILATASTAANGILWLDTDITGRQATSRFKSAGASKWQFGKDSDDSLYVWDEAHGTVVWRVASNGGNFTVTPTLEALGALQSDGDFTAQARIVMTTAVSKLVPGATSFSNRNNADNKDNFILTDAGLATLRNALTIPTAADGTPASTSYGTIPIKFSETLLGGSAASVSFTSIPGTFRHLKVDYFARGDSAVTSSPVFVRFNNDSGSNYDIERQYTSGNGAVSGTENLAQTGIFIGDASANTATAAYFGQASAKVLHYAGTTGLKLIKGEGVFATANTTTTTQLTAHGGKWRTTATAVNRIDVFPNTGNFVAGSFFSIQLEP